MDPIYDGDGRTRFASEGCRLRLHRAAFERLAAGHTAIVVLFRPLLAGRGELMWSLKALTLLCPERSTVLRIEHQPYSRPGPARSRNGGNCAIAGSSVKFREDA